MPGGIAEIPPDLRPQKGEVIQMRRRAILISVIAVIAVISATAVLSQPGWRGSRLRWGDKVEPVTLEGKIKSTERPGITIDVDGKEYILHPGICCRQADGYTFEKDQEIKVTGVVEEFDGVLHVCPQAMEVDGESVDLVDENGFPVRARRRAGYGNGFGRGHRRSYGRGRGRRRGPMHGGGWRGYGRRGC